MIYRNNSHGNKNNFEEFYLVNHDYLVYEAYSGNNWEKLFTVNDVERFSTIQGVDQVQPCFTLTCRMKNYNPDDFYYDEWRASILENETRRAQFQPYTDLLGLSIEDYLDYQHSYSTMVDIIAIDLDQIQDWNLWLTDVQEGEYPQSPDSGLFTMHYQDMLSDSNNAETRVSWHGRYDTSNETHYYFFSDELSIPISGYIECNEQIVVTHLCLLQEFLENVKQENSVTIPSYTEVYIKIVHPLDYHKITREIELLYPDVEIQKVGTAPSNLAKQYTTSAKLARNISIMTFIILGGILVLGTLFENYQSRKQIWFFKSRGWGLIELLSYSLTRSAIIGILGSLLSAILIILERNMLVSSVFTPNLAQMSPAISTIIEPALYNLLKQSTLLKLPFMGVMLSVTTGVLALIYSIYTHPPMQREK